MPVQSIDPELCIKGCCLCADACPFDVLRLGEDKRVYIAYPEDCNSCLWCAMSCPGKAISVSADCSWPWLVEFYP